MIQRTAGETLAISDRVAMMPTVHPAAAGTHEYLECRRVTVRLTVIGRDNMRLTGEMGGSATRLDRCTSRQGLVPVHLGRHWIHGTPAAVSSARRAPARRAVPDT